MKLKLSVRNKADALAAICIALALPAYYKIKYLLEGDVTFGQLLQPSALFEVLYAFLLAVILLVFYRLLGDRIKQFKSPLLKRTLPIVMLAAAALVAILFTRFFFTYVISWGTEASFEFDVALLALILPLIISGVGERIFLEGAKKQAEQDALAAKYEILKSRLSPHFLFNSLNTLVDIVEEDQQLAIKFIEEMATVYRYVLENRDQALVPLKAEVDAIKSVIFLHEIRKPGSLIVDINTQGDEYKKIVPMALQTLVENALKHNIYSPAEPMRLSITINNELLKIENSLNPRLGTISTADGLDNLSRRVAHICQRKLKVVKMTNVFTVEVPIISVAQF